MMKKRIMSGLLTVAMLLSLLPVNVWATDDVVVLDEMNPVTEQAQVAEPVVDPAQEEDIAPVEETENEPAVSDQMAENEDGASADQSQETVENTELSQEPTEDTDQSQAPETDPDETPDASPEETDIPSDEDNCVGGGGHF